MGSSDVAVIGEPDSNRLTIAEQLEVAECLTALNSARDLESIFTIAVQSTARLANANRSTLLLADEKNGEFKVVASHNSCGLTVPGPRLPRYLETTSPFASFGTAPTVRLDGDGRYLLSNHDLPPESSAMVSQIGRGLHPLGILILELPKSARSEPELRRLIDLFLENVGIAIERFQAKEGMLNEVGRLSALVNLGQAVNIAPDFEAMLRYVVDQVLKLAPAEIGSIMLYQPDRAELVLQRPVHGVSETLIRQCHQPPSRGVSGRVFLTGQPYLSNDLERVDTIHPRCFVRRLKCRNMLAAPLKVEDRSIGVLLLHNRRRGDFTDNDVRLVSLLASHAAVLIENARLLENRQETIARLQEFNTVIEKQQQELRRTLAIHDEFTNMVLNGQGLTAILAALNRLTASPVAVEDRFGNLVCRYPETWGEDEPEGDWLGLVNSGSGQESSNDDASGPRRALRLAAGGRSETKHTQVVAPVVVGQETLGTVHVLESNRTLDDLDFVTVERAATAVALQMMREKVEAEAHYKLRSDLVAELLGGNYGPEAMLLRRAGYLGIDMHVPRAVLVGSIDELDGLAPEDDTKETALIGTSEMADVVERACKKVTPGSIVASRGSEIVVLAPYPRGDKTHRGSALYGLCDAVRDRIHSRLPQITISVGIGTSCHTPSDYARSYEQARSALDVVKASRQDRRALAYEEIGIYGVLFDPHNQSRLAPLVEGTLGALLEHDRRHRTQLAQTLDEYFLNDCHLERTAAALHLHSSTLRYRLERVEQILAVDLRSAEARFRIQVALKMRHALGRG